MGKSSALNPSSNDLTFDGEFFAKINDSIVDIITIIDTESRFIFNTPSIERTFGFSQADFLGKSVAEYIHPDDMSHVSAAIARILTGEVETDEAAFRFRTKAGDFKHVHAVARQWHHNGESGLLVNSRDISTQQAALDELAKSNELLSKIYSTSSNLITITLPASGEYLDVNEAWCKTVGFDRDEAIGKTSIELGIWGSEENRNQVIGKLNEQGFLSNHHATLYTRDGQPRTVLIDARILQVADEPRVLLNCQDITDIIAVENELRQAQKMEAVGQLTGGVAHDFNNLIGVTLGNAELLLRNFEPDSKNHHLASQIVGASLKAADLTRQLLAFSRRQTLSPSAVTLTKQLSEMNALLQASIGDNIDLELDLAPSTWQCWLDAAQLESAILNLSLNARDAMPDGGKLSLHTCNHESENGEYVHLKVSDTGTGISEDVKQHVFEPFFTTKLPGKGTGLGLSMVFGFVTQSGGIVDLESKVGAGTTVHIYFPRHLGSDIQPTSSPLVQPERADTQTAIVIEDNAPLRQLVTYYLDDLGYQVFEATGEPSLREVLNEAASVDLIVSDILLQGPLKGPDLVPLIKLDHPKASVLYMTGFAASEVINQKDLCLSKPFSRDQFLDAIAKVQGRI